MTKRGVEVLAGPFDIWDDVESIASSLQTAVEQGDMAVLGRIFQDDAIDKEKLKSSNFEYYAKGDKMFQAWKSDLAVEDKVDMWHCQFRKWYTIVLMKCEGNSNFLVHFLQFNKKYDEVVNFLCCIILPAHSMVKPKAKRPRQASRTPGYELVSVDDIPPPVVVVNADLEIDESTAFQTKSGRLLRRSIARQNGLVAACGRRGTGRVSGEEGPEGNTVGVTGNGRASGKRQKPKNTKDEEDLEGLADWVCAICRQMEAVDGSDLLLCEGGCRRSFHFHCLGLDQAKAGAADAPTWLCDECAAGRHTCIMCGDEGLDNKSVKRCSCGSCGRYYHLNCASSHRHSCIERKGKSSRALALQVATDEASTPCRPAEPSPIGKRVIRRPRRFVEDDSGHEDSEDSEEEGGAVDEWGDLELVKCPSHFCDTCFDVYGDRAKTNSTHRGASLGPLIRCFRCPKAFHKNCIPPDARFNQLVLLCGDHKDEMLPTTEYVSLETGRNSLSFTYAFEQLRLPPARPLADSLTDSSHFRLPISLRAELSSRPPAFQMITKNDEGPLRKDDQEQPLPPGAPKVCLPVHTPDVVCSCVGRCDENCLNRIMKIECCDRGGICNVGKNCGNRQFAGREYVKAMPFKEGEMGWGLRVREDVSAGTLVCEYVGEIITEAQMRRRMTLQRQLTPSDHDFYIMEIENGFYVDGKHKGSLSRFINHSCDPNCELVRWVVKDRIRIGIFAIKDIACDEPLSYDYQFDTQESEAFRCHCGAKTCRGTMAPRKKVIGSKETLSKAEKQRLIAAGRKREGKAERQKEEWKRSYTGRFLPGDGILEIKNGPPRKTFVAARCRKLFLIRNVRDSTNFESRRSMFYSRQSKHE